MPHLRAYWAANTSRRLVEPFCGGLAVTLGLLPQRALVNDVNPHLMNLYRWLKRGLTISIPMENDEVTYYAYRERFNELVSLGKQDSREAAGLFYYLNRTGYNGLCRFNQQGGFNVPFGRYENITYTKDFRKYRQLFADWTFQCESFQTVALAADDFVYADPPYDVEFTQYAKDGFSWEDQVKTAEWLAGHPGPVVLSTPIVRSQNGSVWRSRTLRSTGNAGSRTLVERKSRATNL